MSIHLHCTHHANELIRNETATTAAAAPWNSQLGIATHYVPSRSIPQLLDRLSRLEHATHSIIDTTIEEFYEARSPDAVASSPPKLVGRVRQALDYAFSADSVPTIVERLRAIVEKTGGEGTKDPGGRWAQETLSMLALRSPTSLVVAHEANRRGRRLTLRDAFEMEMRIAKAYCVSRASSFSWAFSSLPSHATRSTARFVVIFLREGALERDLGWYGRSRLWKTPQVQSRSAQGQSTVRKAGGSRSEIGLSVPMHSIFTDRIYVIGARHGVAMHPAMSGFRDLRVVGRLCCDARLASRSSTPSLSYYKQTARMMLTKYSFFSISYLTTRFYAYPCKTRFSTSWRNVFHRTFSVSHLRIPVRVGVPYARVCRIPHSDPIRARSLSWSTTFRMDRDKLLGAVRIPATTE